MPQPKIHGFNLLCDVKPECKTITKLIKIRKKGNTQLNKDMFCHFKYGDSKYVMIHKHNSDDFGRKFKITSSINSISMPITKEQQNARQKGNIIDKLISDGITYIWKQLACSSIFHHHEDPKKFAGIKGLWNSAPNKNYKIKSDEKEILENQFASFMKYHDIKSTNTVQKYVRNGYICTERCLSSVLQAHRLICGQTKWKDLHGALLLFTYSVDDDSDENGKAVNLSIVWSTVSKYGRAIVLNLEDTEVYVMDVKGMLARDEIFVA